MSGTKNVKRVKSGCITCRIRRVKCDEEHPHCARCTSTGRQCDGYSTLPFSRKDLQAASRSALPHSRSTPTSESSMGVILRLVADPTFTDVLEKRYFQYFRQRSVASNNRLVDNRFWDRLVLQACHSEPAIKHAVLALSSLHQLHQLLPGSDAARQHKLYATKQHDKALAAAQQMISASEPQDFDRVLTACVIFIVFESVRGNYAAAGVHMASGRAIVAQNASRLKLPARRKDLIEIEHALARLDLAAVSFSDWSWPYRFSLDDFHQTNPVTVPYDFDDIHGAQTCLIDLCRWLLVAGNHIDEAEHKGDMPTMAKHQAEKERCSSHFARWEARFHAVLARLEQPPELVVLNLKVWHALAILFIKAESYGLETRYDAFLPNFEDIIQRSEAMAATIQRSAPSSMFSYELGYLIPVYFAATRCRDPLLRRRAIAVLRDYPRQEGVLESVAAATIASTWMEAEEDGLNVRCACDVPEIRRLVSTETQVSIERREAWLRLVPSAREIKQQDVLVKWKQSGTTVRGATGTAKAEGERLP